ncbi:hypothetical protein ABEQ04_12240, partial [Cutibacterium acnes]
YFYQAVKVMKSGPRKGEEVPYWTSCTPEDAFRVVPGAGEQFWPTKWDCVVSLAKKQGMTEDELIVQAQVARILRKEDLCWETMRPIPWLPKGRQREVLPA